MKMILTMLSASLILTASTAAQSPAPTPAKTITISERAAPKPAAMPPTATKKAPFRPTKDQIRKAQGKLRAKGTYLGDEDGVYNDPFREAIKKFQKENRLDENGRLDRTTLEKMGIELTDKQMGIVKEPVAIKSGADSKPDPGDKPKGSPIFRATKDQINEAQRKLKAANMYAGEEIGKLDPATREGLRRYQEANGLKVTGTLNRITLQKMGIELTDKQKADAAAEVNK